jgi:hypothetical protein
MLMITKTTNKYHKSVGQFKYLGMTGTNQRYVHKEGNRLNSVNAYYQPV